RVAALPFNCGQLYGEWEREAGKQEWTGKQQWIGMGRSPSGRRRHSSRCFCRRRTDPNTSPPARDEIRRLPSIFAATPLFGLPSSTPQNAASVWLADFGRTAAGTGVRRSQPRVPVDRLGQLEDLLGEIQ